MANLSNQIDVYLEIGAKRVFAGAVEWPGWARSGRDEASALQALLDYAPRYARVVRPARLGFEVPKDVSSLAVRERLRGNSTTDFGTPGLPPAADERPVDKAALRRLQAVLKACWRAFDAAAEAAAGKELRRGPRGGGRELDAIREHVWGAEAAYLLQLGAPRLELGGEAGQAAVDVARQAVLKGLVAAVNGEFPKRGPRGGLRWTPRYFVRRAAWHVLDHAWEVEDRSA